MKKNIQKRRIIMIILLCLLFPSFAYAQNQYSRDLSELDLYVSEERWFIANNLYNEMIILFPQYSRELHSKYSYVSENYRRSLDKDLLSDVDVLLDGFLDIDPESKDSFKIKRIKMKTSLGCPKGCSFYFIITIKDEAAIFSTASFHQEVKLDVIENFLRLSKDLITSENSLLVNPEEENVSKDCSYGVLLFEYETENPEKYENEKIVVKYDINEESLENQRLYLLVYYLYYWLWPRFF